jgi:hypothetical protein
MTDGLSSQTPSPTPPKQRKPVKTHLNARKRVIDPSKPLKNPKHEIMARELAKGQCQVDAYKRAYPKASNTTAQGNASRLIASTNINERALKLLDSVGLSEKKLAQTLNKHVDSETAQISLDATKTGFKLLGYGQESKESTQSYNPTQINIIIKQRDTQPVDSIEVTPVKDE